MKTSLEIQGVKPGRALCESSIQLRPATTVKTESLELFLSGKGGVTLNEFDFEPVEIFSIQNCIILPTGLVINPDGWVVAESLEGSLADNGIPENNILAVEINAEFTDPVYCTSKFGTFNYSVFLHEVLPSIYVAGSHACRAAGFTLGYARFFQKSRRDKFLELFSPFYDPVSAIDISTLTSFCREALVVSAGAKKHNIQRIKQVMPDLISEFSSTLDMATLDTPERIYIMRERGTIRELENREDVMAWARRNGFACIELTDLTFSQQASYFRNASVIFAEHGAGLANLWHCKKGTKVFEIFPEKLWGRWLYRAISSLSGFEYVATSFETPDAWVWNRDPVNVSVNILNKGLAHFEGVQVR